MKEFPTSSCRRSASTLPTSAPVGASRKVARSPCTIWWLRSETFRCSSRLMPKTCALSFLNELRTRTLPRRTADVPETFENSFSALMTALGSSTPSMYFTPSRWETRKSDPPPALMLRSVSCIWSWMRRAPSVPRMVLMKKSSKPLVVAWVTMNRPTPSTVQDRLISMARFFAVRNRKAMRRLGDMGRDAAGRARRLFDQLRAHPVAVAELVQLLDNHLVAGREALGDFRDVHADIAHLHLAELHPAIHHGVDIVAEKGPAGDQRLGRPLADDDVHFTRQPRHQDFRRAFDIQQHAIALGLGLGGGENLHDLGLIGVVLAAEKAHRGLLPELDVGKVLLADLGLDGAAGGNEGRDGGI